MVYVEDVILDMHFGMVNVNLVDVRILIKMVIALVALSILFIGMEFVFLKLLIIVFLLQMASVLDVRMSIIWIQLGDAKNP